MYWEMMQRRLQTPVFLFDPAPQRCESVWAAGLVLCLGLLTAASSADLKEQDCRDVLLREEKPGCLLMRWAARPRLWILVRGSQLLLLLLYPSCVNHELCLISLLEEWWDKEPVHLLQTSVLRPWRRWWLSDVRLCGVERWSRPNISLLTQIRRPHLTTSRQGGDRSDSHTWAASTWSVQQCWCDRSCSSVITVDGLFQSSGFSLLVQCHAFICRQDTWTHHHLLDFYFNPCLHIQH